MSRTKNDVFNDIYNSAASSFRAHYKLSGNSRIIFSGKFGIGKTTFLKRFLKEQANTVVFRISPIHYSISSNEDIVNYIKYDLIYGLIQQNFIPQHIPLTPRESIPFFVLQDKEQTVVKAIISMIPKIGQSLSNVVDKIVSTSQKIEQFQKDAKMRLSDQERLLNFLEKVDTVSPFVNDVITLIIKKGIEKIKEKNKKVVLVIDDLDRVDPEHIFRILNVFAAHFDDSYTGNRYGFDKVIVVCDVENLRSIFYSKYGVQTDFSGYLDKFYSLSVFKYDPYHYFIDILDAVFSEREEPDYLNNNTYYRAVLFSITEHLIENGELDLRNLTKKVNLSGLINEQIETKYEELVFTKEHVAILLAFRLAANILGDGTQLCKSLEASTKWSSLNVLTYTLDSTFHIIELLRGKGSVSIQNSIEVTIEDSHYRLILESKRGKVLYVNSREVSSMGIGSFSKLIIALANKFNGYRLLD